MPPLQAISMGGGGQEDRHTYVLASLLQHERVARGFATRVLGLEVNANAVLVADIQHIVESGRADLRLSGEGVYAIVEVKVDAWLHGEQMRAYAIDVARHAGGRLFVLTPSTTLLGIRAEARAQVAALSEDPAASVVVDGISWQQVADFLHGMVAQDPDLPDHLRVYLEDFASLVYTAIEGDRRPFDDAELEAIRSARIGDITERLEMVLFDALNELSHTFPFTKGHFIGGRGFLGRNLRIGEYQAWVGMVGAAWREQGRTPFYVQSLGLLRTWDRIAEERRLPHAVARRGIVETLVPIEFDTGDGSLEALTANVVRAATPILHALPDAYRAGMAPVVGATAAAETTPEAG